MTDHWEAIHSAPGRDEQIDLAGTLDLIVDVFNRVPSRRLVVLGGPGAGKTILALRLVLGLFDRRQPGDQVPILLSVASWNPTSTPLRDWIAQRLAADYPGLRVRTAAGSTLAWDVVTAGRVMPVLDGLDEIPQPLQTGALTALNRALLQGDPLILTCRTQEYEEAITASGDVLTAAAVVELSPLGLEDLRAYLRVTTPLSSAKKWDEVFTELDQHPDGPVAQALTTPLMAWLARTAYSDSPASPGELLATDRDGNRLLGDRATVEGSLLDRLIPSVYAHGPDEQSRFRWASGDVNRWLTLLALHLRREGTRDLAWWQLYRDVPRLVFGLVGSLAYGLAAGLAGGLVGGLGHGLVGGLVYELAGDPAFGVVTGLVGGLAFGLMFGLGDRFRLWPDPSRVQVDFRAIMKLLLWRLSFGLVIGLSSWLAFGPVFGIAGGLMAAMTRSSHPSRVQITFRGIGKSFLWRAGFGLVFGLVCGLALGLMPGLPLGIGWGLTCGVAFGLAIVLTVWIDAPADAARVTSPPYLLKLDRTASLAFGLATGVAAALTFAITGRFVGGLILAGGIVGGFLGGFILGLTGAWCRLLISQAWFALTSRLPWSLMEFLADAHRRGVLRQAGAVYQFRHARLQDRLVAHATTLAGDIPADLPASARNSRTVHSN